MAELESRCTLGDADLAYRMLMEAHRGLSDDESAALNARLVLILVNQLGDIELLRRAIALARAAAPPIARPSS